MVCTVRTSTGWRQVYSPPGDWGFVDARAWVPSPHGAVSYCATVGSPEQQKLTCTSFDGKTFAPASVSPITDWGFPESRAWVSTKPGPAMCGRAGELESQQLVCTVRTSTGWRQVYSPPGDWGFVDARAWVPSPHGAVSYCATVGSPEQQKLTCTSFDGKTFAPASVSPITDWGFPESRAWVSVKGQ